MNGNDIFNIFTKKVYWIICLTVPIIFPAIFFALKIFKNATDISVLLIIFSYFI